MSSLSDFIGAASSSLKNAGISSITSAAGQIAQGNLSGAVSDLFNEPQQALATLGASGNTSFADDFSGLQKRGDAIQNWCWYAVLPDITNPNALSSPSGLILGQAISSAQPIVSLPWYYVQSANVPQREFNVESFKRNAHDVHRPNGYSVGALTLGLFMDSTNKSHQWLKAWQSLVMSNLNPKVVANQGNWGYPSSYMKDITLVVLSVTKQVLLNVKLINCWPTLPAALELISGEAAGLVQEVTFSVEDVDITVNNDKGLLDTLINTATGYASSAITGVLSSQLNAIFTT
jgi:hypothetical protein